jgi:TRAP-type mannitol/chloroaromatic compound transport system substrate-binding protein
LQVRVRLCLTIGSLELSKKSKGLWPGSEDDVYRRIYRSYQQFRVSIMDWSDISERAYLNSRRLFS